MKEIRSLQTVAGWLVLACAMGLIAAVLTSRASAAGAFLTASLSFLAFWISRHPTLKGFAFTAWVFAFVGASMAYPKAFGTWAGYDLKFLIVPLIQIIMFGMGTTLSAADFTRIMVMPWPVFIGMFLQFSIMPCLGFLLAHLFGFPPEIAAGVVLIGCVAGGVASNVITYLANGNVALSVTMTACSTLLSPFLTPALMKLLAGRMIHIDVTAMFVEILNMVIVPVATGLLANRILFSADKQGRSAGPLMTWAIAGFVVAIAVLFVPPGALGIFAPLRNGVFLGASLLGVVALAKLLIEVLLRGPGNWMNKALPFISMAAICFIIAIITSRSRDKLMTVGLALIGAAVVHNGLGYLLGYWCSKAIRLDEMTCRTVAIEVGMQNGGMASGLAMAVLKSADAALAPAIFGPWMNISGSILASWWRKKPIPNAPQPEPNLTSPKTAVQTSQGELSSQLNRDGH